MDEFLYLGKVESCNSLNIISEIFPYNRQNIHYKFFCKLLYLDIDL